MNEIKLGEATYLVHRSFIENRSVSEVVIERLLQSRQEKTAFDEAREDAV